MPAFTFEKLSSPAPRVPAARAPEPSVEPAKPRGWLRRMLDRLTTRATQPRTESLKREPAARR